MRKCANCWLYDPDEKICIDGITHEPDDTCSDFIGAEVIRFGTAEDTPDLTLKQVEDWCYRHNYKLMTEECYDELTKEK